MRNWEYHCKGRRNNEPDYTEQVRFERQLEGLGLSDDAIAYVLANPPILHRASRMVKIDPKLSLEAAIMRCYGRNQETEGIDYLHGMPVVDSLPEDEMIGNQEQDSLPPHIRTEGNFIPMKKVRRLSASTSVVDCPFSRLPEKYRKQVECQVLGLHRDDPLDSLHLFPEHAISYERD